MVDCEQIHLVTKARRTRRLEWWLVGRRSHQSTTGAFQSRLACGRRDGYVTVPQIHDWLELDRGLGIERQPGRIQGALCVFAAAQH